MSDFSQLASQAFEQQSQEQPTQSNETEQGQVQQEQEQLPGWLSGVSQDIRGHEYLKGYKNTNEFAKHYIDFREKYKNAIMPINETMPEEIAQYRKSIGAPESIDGFELPDEYDGLKMAQDHVAVIKQVAFEEGLTPKQLQKLVETDAKYWKGKLDEHTKVETERVAKSKSEQEAKVKAITDKIKSKLGNEYESTRKLAEKGLMVFQNNKDWFDSPEAAQKHFEERGYINDPIFFELLAASGAMACEGSFLDGATASPEPDGLLPHLSRR